MRKAMEVHRLRVAGVVLALAWAGLAAGCGGADEPAAPNAASAIAAEEPEALEQPEAVANPKPAKPETLRLLDGGNPTVFVRLGQEVELFDEPGGALVETVGHATEFGSRTVFAVTEQRGNWVSVSTAFTENGRPLWLELDPELLRAGRSEWEIEVDLSDYRADLFLDGKRVRSFAVSIGMPSAPTPTGRFAVTDTFRGGLNAAYGCCAVALTARQSNLPSGWLGGDRIAIHGTTGPLSSMVSHGCVRAADADVSDLVDKVPPGTPVTIRQ